jgi:manganese oxidase
MLPRKGVLSNLIGFLVLVMLINGLANGQTVTTATDEKPVPTTKQTQADSNSISEPAIDTESKPILSSEVVASTTAEDKTKIDSPAKPVPAAKPQATPAQCKRMLTANVVAMPQPIMLNRLGAVIPDGLIFALKRDTVTVNNQIQLRPGKRPRPLVLRANVGDCMTVTFTNAIPANSFSTPVKNFSKTGTTEVSLHVQGMEWVTSTGDDGSFAGKNHSSLASVNPVPPNMPASTQTYTLFAKNEGTYLLYTMGDTTTQGIQLTRGLFGALNVQPAKAEWYRSQVTATELNKATYNANNLGSGNTLNCPNNANPCSLTVSGKPPVQVNKTPSGALNTLDNHPLINYNAVDGNGTPILNMLKANTVGNQTTYEILYSDLTAIITGPNAGRFEGTTGPNNPEPPCNAENNPNLPGGAPDPNFCANPAAPDRKQPYREITTMYYGGLIPVVTQAFPVFTDPTMSNVVEAGDDAFAINYGSGGIAAEVYGNRIGVGPMGDCVDCKFEEFFLSAWSVGDPAMLVDKPANSGMQAPCTTTAAFNSPPCGGSKSSNTFPYTMHPTMKATAAFFPDDPSNVFHSYINDHVKFRILHGGRDVTHVHHQHAHQWLQSPNSDESSYLDSQMISPGASYTLEMTYNGSGNRNKVVGDSIFHCHFYPHFAAGMWAMWRTHDTFESGTYVFPSGSANQNQVVPGSRALPDGEITAGSPTPAIVPLPTLPMAPLPAYAQIQTNVKVNGETIPLGGQVVIGGTCSGNKINGLDVIGGCTNGQLLNGTVINSAFNGTQMTGQFEKSLNNALLNPGFPYFIPGIAGARAPHPPFDFAPDGSGGFMDGGLPRHVVASGSVSYESHDQFDWSKDVATMSAIGLPETGTDVEKAAITYFSERCHQTNLPDGSASNCAAATPFGFILNGLPNGPQPGAPFADPAVDDLGNPVGTKRVYQAAAFQLDVAFNTKRWHFPQQRMLSLWKDVQPTLNFSPVNAPAGSRPPEPLFFRGNTGDIIEYWHTNLVPNYYAVDDFQVRTPTDILGQHIHLVKFDVTSSDGAGNGFNYEDGTFSPGDVQDQINAINAAGGLKVGNSSVNLTPKPPPADIFNCSANPNDPRCKPCPPTTLTSRPVCQSWVGAQTTIQRWYIDPLLDNSGTDRTMRTVFTHDHFGPSTHQQAGLYAGLLIEPAGASWRDPETGQIMGRPANQPPIRSDGGPTSWKVDILTANSSSSYREFMMEFADLQLAYAWASVGTTNPPKQKEDPNPKKGWMDPAYAINAPSGNASVSAPNLISTGTAGAPPGTQVVNYRNAPIAWRVGQANDMSYAFDSSLKQASNAQPNGDPFTPLLRAYQGDNVQVRTLVGAHVFAHQFNFAGPTWFAEPSWQNSGYRSAQAMGLSEHFEFLFKVPSSSAPNTNRKCPDGQSQKNCVDYFYSPSMDEFGISNGMWGLFRSYDPTATANKLAALPNNPIGAGTNVTYATCPANAPQKNFNVTAIAAQTALGGEISFNTRGAGLKSTSGVMYVRTEDLNTTTGKLNAGVPIEPLILRANAGDCITVNLTNKLDPSASVFQQQMFMAPPFSGVSPANGQPVFKSQMSKMAGLHPQLLSYDPASSQGQNIGWNRSGRPDQLAAFGNKVTYQWYAGKIDRSAGGSLTYTPVEFGTLNLFPSDLMYQQPNGLFGAMVIEPATTSSITCDGPSGTQVSCDPIPAASPQAVTRAAATVTAGGSPFREFVTMFSDNLRISGGNASAVNYRTEPQGFRFSGFNTTDFSCMTSNQLVNADPQTPIFNALAGESVRFRLLHTFGTGTSQVFSVHGHNWQRNPYSGNSTVLGSQVLSQWLGSRDNYGSSDHADLLISKAGGEGGIPGDYLYTAFVPIQGSQGPWGLFRVGSSGSSSGGTDGVLTANGACPQTPAAAPSSLTPTPKQPDLDRFIRRPLNSNPRP